MKVSVIGTGYVGLVAAAAFAEHGNDVVCADIDAAKIEGLENGIIPIYEPGLEPLVKRNVAAGRLRFTTSNPEAAKHAEVVFLAVGTPTGGSDGAPKLDYLFQAARDIAPHLNGFSVIVNKSTVPVGTAERVARIIAEQNPKAQFTVASNPEFLKEGVAVQDFMHPDRVIIGTEDERARELLNRLYKPFFRTSERLLYMSARSAELTKYAANAYLAARISFINDVANLCDAVGADVEQVRRGMGSDARIGNKFLFPGLGYGGSCFPKDTRALIRIAREHGISMSIVAAADRINEAQKLVLVRKVRAHFGNEISGKNLAIWGLAFKPNTDDIREAPALTIVRSLASDGAKLRICDPEAGPSFMEALGDTASNFDIELVSDPYAAADAAAALVLCTEWRQYRSPDFRRLAEVMRGKALFDGRNQWDRDHVESLGFTYSGIGR
ncbi:UDP-glucose dehydrogenase family protein [Enhygromyxa salina]|uniref:UDP-glucose dehydrogenase family protein n=1 Tax=Enhygromyxa salina TaxID=215803 RepID=UPI000698867B|nr:UDP-glucose/GDP-mannose dehydrogenase family protein [Enhygromyxa salina]